MVRTRQEQTMKWTHPGTYRRMLWKAFLPILFLATLLIAVPGVHAQNLADTPSSNASTAGAAPASNAATVPPSAAGAPSYGAVADLLENESSRRALIDQLRNLAAKPGAAPTATDAPATAAAGAREAPPTGGAATPAAGGDITLPEADQSLSRRVADGTQNVLQHIAADFAQAFDAFRSLGRGEGVSGVSMAQWLSALTSMAIVVAATLLAYAVLRAIASRGYARIDAWVAQHPQESSRHTNMSRLYRYMVAVVGALLIDIGVIALAGVAGYATGVYTGRQPGVIGTLESMFVNAFLAVEIARALVRTVFATRYQHLRLLPMTDDIATYWNGWLGRLIALTGYGIMIVVPLVKAMFSPAVGQAVGLLLMLGVYIYAVRVIWRNRTLLRERLERRADTASTAFFGTLIRILARVWHLIAIAYFTVLLVVSQIATESALPFMARATAQTLVAIALGLMLSALLTGVLARRIQLSGAMRERLPMLEARINSYVPATLKTLRTLILIVVVLVVLDAWRAFNLAQWLASDHGTATIGMITHVGIILLFAALAWTLIASVIEHRLSNTVGRAPSARERTLLALFRNAALVVILTMTVLVVLSQIGINIAPLIAGAGVVGLAIGFGAQKLVQDIITGIFIQIENGMNVNDVVEAGGVFGTVEKITIRSVGIRTLDGGYHMIPFSSVDTVVNHMRDFSYHLGEYTIAHRESVDDAIFHLERAFDELKQDSVLAPEILEDITIPGVTSLNERGFTIRVLIKTTPGMQWAVQRGYNRLVKKHFNAADIELPYPHSVVYFGQDKKGNAPAANVHVEAERPDYADDTAPATGHTPRPLTRPAPASEEVLGNELDAAVEVDDDNEPLSNEAKHRKI